MINRLIDMNIAVSKPHTIQPSLPVTNYTIQEYALAFISGLNITQKERFKQMLENGIECGMSVAKSYGINYKEFIKEIKNQLGVD